MSAHIIVSAPVEPTLMAALEGQFTIHRLWEAEDPQAFIREHAPVVRGLVTRSMIGADAALMDALPNLEIISVFGVGTDAVDLAAAKARGIAVTNTPGVLTADTSDYGMTLVLALARQISAADNFVRAGRWPKEPFPNATRVNGKRLGIVGLGRIGQGVARRAAAFDMKIAYTGPREKDDVPYEFFPDVEALARDVDFLVLTCPGGKETENLVDAKVLEALGAGGMLVNIARASVVDEPALIAALKANTIKAAALDVFTGEPNVTPEFFELDNVLLGPHIASKTVETQRDIGNLVFANIAAHFEGGDLPSPVT